MSKRKLIAAVFILIPLILLFGMAWLLWGGISNPAARHNIDEISTPAGFERAYVESGSFGEFIRFFPLQKRGSHLKYYNGTMAYGQYFGYAVLDLPMISEIEQCADGDLICLAWQRGVGVSGRRSVGSERLSCLVSAPFQGC